MDALCAPVIDDLWNRLEREAAIDDETCACTVGGSWICSRHAHPSQGDAATIALDAALAAADTAARAAPGQCSDSARLSARASFRAMWRVTVVVAVACAIGSVGLGVAQAMSRSASYVAEVAAPPAAAFGPSGPSGAPRGASEPELPPMSLSTPTRLALLAAAVGSLVGGLSLGLTRRERPARQRRVGPGMTQLPAQALR